MGTNIEAFTKNINLKVVTPLFLGNAQLEDAKDETISNIPSELRPPSIKGVLRFWYRAMGPDNLKTEAEYFGSTKGQSSFLLQVQKLPKSCLREEPWDNSLGYLGYGPIIGVKVKIEGRTRRELLSRQYIEPGEELIFRLVFRPGITLEARKAVLRSFRLLSLFGGLGSRSRHGFGSVICNGMKSENIEQLRQCIKNELRQCSHLNEKALPYTAVSAQTKVLLMEGDLSWVETLQMIGKLLQKFRSFRTQPPESRWPKNDHDLIFDYLTKSTIEKAPSRSVYGLPHNYYFSSLKLGATVEGSNDKFARRASPLFIHIHQLRNEQCIVVISFFPAQFLREGVSLKVKDANGKISSALEVPDWAAISDFLNFLKDQHGAQEVDWRS